MNRHFASWLCGKNSGVMSAYNEIKSYEGHFEELVSRHFAKLLTHARNTVPFYKDIPLVDVNQISALPILTKETIRSFPDQLVSSSKNYPLLAKYFWWFNRRAGDLPSG